MPQPSTGHGPRTDFTDEGRLVELDSRGRAHLGRLIPGVTRYLAYVDPDGVITLRPAMVIPANLGMTRRPDPPQAAPIPTPAPDPTREPDKPGEPVSPVIADQGAQRDVNAAEHDDACCDNLVEWWIAERNRGTTLQDVIGVAPCRCKTPKPWRFM